MRKMITMALSLLVIAGIALEGQAQQLAAEKSLDISGKAKRGYLGNVVVDDARQQIDLVYVTKSTNRKVKFEAYQFDYDLNLINQIADEQEVDKARTKYKWFNFRGKDVETITGVTAEADLMGRAVFKKKEITYRYNWFTGKYKKDVKVLEKLKPKTEDGKKMFFYGAYDLDESGEVMALVGHKGKGVKGIMDHQKKFSVMRVNNQLDIVKDEPVIFEHIQWPLFKGPLLEGAMSEDEEQVGDWILVFAPVGGQGLKQYADPDPTNYTYVRISRDGSVKERFNFTTKVHTWKIDAAYEKDGTVFLYGPGKSKKLDKTYLKNGENPALVEKGFENFQIMGIKGGKAMFLNAPAMEEFEAKAAKPDNQKKPVLYKGGKIVIGGLSIASSGDIFINAQEWKYDAVGDYRGNIYKDFLMFHFNKNGELVKSYGIDNPQKGGLKGLADARTDPRYYPTNATIFEGTDNQSVFWMSLFVSKIDKKSSSETIGNTTYTTTWYTPKLQPRIGKVDIGSGKIHDFITYGGDDHFLYDKHPFVQINGGKQTIFLGESGNGKNLWLGKFDPSAL